MSSRVALFFRGVQALAARKWLPVHIWKQGLELTPMLLQKPEKQAVSGPTKEGVDGWMVDVEGLMEGWMMDGMDGWMDGWNGMDGMGWIGLLGWSRFWPSVGILESQFVTCHLLC